MFPQGSGKTSLLQILAGQRQAASGRVLLNDTPMGPAAKRHIGMLPQEDVILPTVTVEEALSFSAALRLPVGDFLQISFFLTRGPVRILCAFALHVRDCCYLENLRLPWKNLRMITD